MKRPLAIVALCYAAGILAGEFWPFPFWLALFAGLALATLALLWFKRRSWLIIPLLGFTGLANHLFHSEMLSPIDLRRWAGDEAAIVVLRGRLVETPYQRVRGDFEDDQWRSLARIRVDAIQREGGPWQAVSGRVMASTPGILPPWLHKGQTVEVNGVLRPPRGRMADGLFDYRRYLARLGVHYQLSVRSPDDWVAPASRSIPPLSDRFIAWAKHTLALGLPEEDEPLRLLWAMTLGWKTALSGEVSEPFMRSGTMHIFAISGLHIALISGILVALLRVVRVPRGWCGAVVIPLLWAYAYVTGWQASAVRSTVMMSVIICGWSLRRPSDLLNSLAAAAFLILLWDPLQLFQAGFQLSFFVVLSLALFEPLAKRLRESIDVGDPLLPREFLPAWKGWLEKALRWLGSSGLTSLAAWIGSIPLVAYYFHLITPVSLLANVIVVPLSGFALASNLASLLTGAWWPWAAAVFNHGAWLWMRCMVAISEWAAELPSAWFHVAAPSLFLLALYYAIFLSVAGGLLRRQGVRVWTGAGLAIASLMALGQLLHERGSTRLTILPLSGGEAIYYEPPEGNERLLVDCGNETAVEFVVRPFLASRGVNQLPQLALTHGDLKNFGGISWLEHAFKVKEILHGPVDFRSPAYRQIQQQWLETKRPVRSIRRGSSLGPWTVLHPGNDDRFTQADDAALVFLGSIAQTRVLLMSDLGRRGQNALINRQTNLWADIIVAGLPTQSEPLAEGLLDAIQPRAIIITDAEYPATERASPRLRDRLAARNIPVTYTREAGAVTLEWRGTNCQLRTGSGLRLRINDLPRMAPREEP